MRFFFVFFPYDGNERKEGGGQLGYVCKKRVRKHSTQWNEGKELIRNRKQFCK